MLVLHRHCLIFARRRGLGRKGGVKAARWRRVVVPSLRWKAKIGNSPRVKETGLTGRMRAE